MNSDPSFSQTFKLIKPEQEKEPELEKIMLNDIQKEVCIQNDLTFLVPVRVKKEGGLIVDNKIRIEPLDKPIDIKCNEINFQQIIYHTCNRQ